MLDHTQNRFRFVHSRRLKDPVPAMKTITEKIKFENKLCAFAEIKEATQKTGHTRA